MILRRTLQTLTGSSHQLQDRLAVTRGYRIIGHSRSQVLTYQSPALVRQRSGSALRQLREITLRVAGLFDRVCLVILSYTFGATLLERRLVLYVLYHRCFSYFHRGA
jgi:hypothetical protein